MEVVRLVASRLVQVGQLEVLQRGKVVDPLQATGPIRLRIAAQT